MSETPEERLQALGIVLPNPPMPVANYVPYLIVDDILHISGQLPLGPNGLVYKGKLGEDVSLEEGVAAARLSATNILAQAKAAVGALSQIRRVISITAFVASTPTFTQHPVVVNGASDLLGAVFGERGKHTRSSVGVAVLPLDATVEIEARLAV